MVNNHQKSRGDFITLLSASTRGLMILSVGLLAIILLKIYMIKQGQAGLMPADLSVDDEKYARPEIELPPAVPFDRYTEVIKRRDVFSLPQAGGDIDANEINETPIAKTYKAELLKQYKLVGILLDNDPMAVIEDLDNKETLFLLQGDQIGEIKLERVEEGSAVFVYNNERIELMP